MSNIQTKENYPGEYECILVATEASNNYTKTSIERMVARIRELESECNQHTNNYDSLLDIFKSMIALLDSGVPFEEVRKNVLDYIEKD